MTMVEEAGPALLSIAGGVFAVAGGHEQSPRMAMTGLRFAGILGQVPKNVPSLLESDVVAFIQVRRRALRGVLLRVAPTQPARCAFALLCSVAFAGDRVPHWSDISNSPCFMGCPKLQQDMMQRFEKEAPIQEMALRVLVHMSAGDGVEVRAHLEAGLRLHAGHSCADIDVEGGCTKFRQKYRACGEVRASEGVESAVCAGYLSDAKHLGPSSAWDE
jgi:hypothetical protein